MKQLFIITISIIWIVIGVSATIGKPISVYDIPVTRDLTGAPLPTRAEYLQYYPEREFVLHLVESSALHRDDGSIVLAVNQRLYNALEDHFTAWIEDLSQEEYEVILIVSEGGSAQELKEVVIEEGGDELVGVIFAGEQPLAWYEHHEHFWGEDEPDNQRIVEYPIDMFFMDLDGVWEDTTGNDVYDHHYGDVDPDIWLGRLPAYNLSRMDEDEVIAAYLDRVHRYRQGEIELPHRALNYIDDDWAYLADRWSSNIRHAYGQVLIEAEPDTTRAADYWVHLENDEVELVQVAVHSTSDSHSFLFTVDDTLRRDYFRFWDLRDEVESIAMFYNLFACSIMNTAPRGRHRNNLCLGVLYALGGPYGLGSVGSTKTGSMLFFDDYYIPLYEGACFGESLRLWMTMHAHEPERQNWARSWFYGMTHYGDPTLTIKQGLRAVNSVIDDPDGDNDAILDAGEIASLAFSITNRGEVSFDEINVIIFSEDPSVEIIENEGFINEVRPEEEEVVEGFVIRVDENCIDGHVIPFDVSMNPLDEEPWGDRVEVPVRAPRLEVVGIGWDEIEGNGNGWTEAGETGVISIHFRNDGGDEMHMEGAVELISLDDWFIVDNEVSVLQQLNSGEVGHTRPEGYRISQDAEGEQAVYIQINSMVNEIPRGSGIITLPISPDFQFDDELNDEPVWFHHYVISEGFDDVWRWSIEAGQDSSGGFAFGGPDTLEYPPHCDAAFELPLMMFEEDAILEIRHRLDIETEYDACIIEVDRGAGWQRTEPEGGYNGNSVENGLYTGGPCWNGTFDWTDARVQLGGPAGALRIRFRLSSDTGVEGNGWFIDRIRVTGTPLDAATSVVVPYEFALCDVFPNPFNSRLTISYILPKAGLISFRLYDSLGRNAATLYNGIQIAGYHRIAFEAEGLSSGVYVMCLEQCDNMLFHKIVLLK